MNKNESLRTTFDELNQKYSNLSRKQIEEILLTDDEYQAKVVSDTALEYLKQAWLGLKEFAPHEIIKQIATTALFLFEKNLFLVAVSGDHEGTLNIFNLSIKNFSNSIDSDAMLFFSAPLIPEDYHQNATSHPIIDYETPVLIFPITYPLTARETSSTALVRALATAFYICNYYSWNGFKTDQVKRRQNALLAELLRHLQEVGFDTSTTIEELNIPIDEFPNGIDALSGWDRLQQPIIPLEDMELN